MTQDSMYAWNHRTAYGADGETLLPVKHAGYKGFVEPVEGHHAEMEEVDREYDRAHESHAPFDTDLYDEVRPDPNTHEHNHFEQHDEYPSGYYQRHDEAYEKAQRQPQEDTAPIGHHTALINFVRNHGSNHDLWNSKGSMEDVDLRRQPIHATQPYLVQRHLDRYMANPHDEVDHVQKYGPNALSEAYHGTHHPMFVRHEGNMFAIEGHHRTGAAMLRNEPHIHGIVYDADQHGWPENKFDTFEAEDSGFQKHSKGRQHVDCDYHHRDPEKAWAHAHYNHDDGVCAATERKRAKRKKHGSLQVDAELGFHFVATWADVRNKAKRIRSEGGVHVVVASSDGIGGNVQGDTGIYETILSYRPGSYKVASWTCGCAWAAYAWNRSPAYRRFEGRMCSHALALQFEAQARGMFGRTVQEDNEHRPGWLRDKARSRYDRDTGTHVEVNAVRHDPLDPEGVYPADHGLDLARPPAYAFAVAALAEGAEPAAALRTMLDAGLQHAAARTLLHEAIEATAGLPGPRHATRCPDCGAEISSTANRCPKCGADLHPADPATAHLGANTTSEMPLDQVMQLSSGDYPGSLVRQTRPQMEHEWRASEHGDGDLSEKWSRHGGPGPYIEHVMQDIAQNGIQEPLKVTHHGEDTWDEDEHPTPHVLTDGHTRAWAAHALGLDSVPVEHIYAQPGRRQGAKTAGYDDYGDWDGREEDEESQAHSRDWDDIHSGIEELHRGVGVMLHPHDHAIVHDQSRPVHERAHHLLNVMSKGDHVRAGVGTHWTTTENVADDFAGGHQTRQLASGSKHEHMQRGDHAWGHDDDGDPKGQPATAVMFHAHQPDRDEIDENPDEMAHGSSGIYGYHDHGEREVPIRPGGSVPLKGISWKPVHDTFDEPDDHDDEYTRHDFPEPHHVTAAKDEPEEPTHAGMVLKAADTGRILMIQRSHQDPDDPAAGTWEFPGGGREPGDPTSLHSGIREFEEEVGHPFPLGGHVQHVWQSPNGVYQGHVVVVPSESALDFSHGRSTVNPDDPDGDDHEQSAWWDPDHARKNPALRPECKSSPWDMIKKASLDFEAFMRTAEHRPERIDGRVYTLRDVDRAHTREGFDHHDLRDSLFTHERVPIDSLRLPGGLPIPSTREISNLSGDDRSRLQEIQHGYDNESDLPPIVVVRQGPHHVVIDGSHRAAVHADGGETHIPAFVTGDHINEHQAALRQADYAAQDTLGDLQPNYQPKPPPRPLDGAGENPGSTGFATAGDPPEFGDAATRAQTMSLTFDSAMSAEDYNRRDQREREHLDRALGPQYDNNSMGGYGRMPWGGMQNAHDDSVPWGETKHEQARYPHADPAEYGAWIDHFDPENPAHHQDQMHGAPKTPDGLPIRSLNILHAEPEAALPSTEGGDDDLDTATTPAEQFRSKMRPEIGPTDLNGNPNSVHAARSTEEIVAAFQATAAATKLQTSGGGKDDMDIASAARAYLSGDTAGGGMQKSALKDFSYAEQQALITEGAADGTVARNLGDLQIEGTHYAAIEAALSAQEQGDPDDLFI